MKAKDLLPTELIVDNLDQWLCEDGLHEGDATSEALLVDEGEASMHLVARESMMVCGLEPLSRGLEAMECDVRLAATVDEGAHVGVGGALGTLSGDRRSALSLERTILNILGRTCGVASLTREYVDQVSGTKAVITDTRKTMPGLRNWDKYAVVCGGGTSHRMGLHDALLIKDNHLAAFSAEQVSTCLEDAVVRARTERDLAFVEVEVDTITQLDAVLHVAGVDMILLDNMTIQVMREAVQRRDASAPHVLLEASGGITLSEVRAVAEAGVDRIAIGALTRDAVMLDIGLDA